MTAPPTLDCQDCGEVLRTLAPEEAQLVAGNPYSYVSYCRNCKRGRA